MMTTKHPSAISICLFLCFNVGVLSCAAQTMAITYGINAGATFSAVNAILTIRGEEAAKSDQAGSGSLGYHAGIFGNMPISSRLSLQGEIGFDYFRFRSYQEIFNQSSVRQWRLGVSSNYQFFKHFGLLCGVELGNRNNRSEENLFGKLNGLDVSGLHWQGILGIRVVISNRLKIDARAAFPKMKSVTRVFDGFPMDERLIIEQLRIFKLVASYTIFPR